MADKRKKESAADAVSFFRFLHQNGVYFVISHKICGG